MNKKLWIISLITFSVMFLATPMMASAHVTVHPTESSTNAWEKYSVRIPVEKDVNTTSVKLKVPDELNLVSIMPSPDWSYELEKDDNDNITSVTWTAEKDGIGPNEFIEFYFVVANPEETGEFSWEAFQTYEDDSVVEWVGSPESEEPASVTKVVEGDAVAEHGGEETIEDSETSNNEAKEESKTSNSNNWLPLVLSGIALLLALVSLFKKKS